MVLYSCQNGEKASSAAVSGLTDVDDSAAASNGDSTSVSSGNSTIVSNNASRKNSIGNTSKANTTGTSRTVPEPKVEFMKVDGPEASKFEAYDLTAARLKPKAWTDNGFHMFLEFHKSGVLQIGKGGTMTDSYASYGDPDGMFNKLLNMDIAFYCPSELTFTGTQHTMQSVGHILFRAVQESDMSKRNPCYVLEYEESDQFYLRLGKYTKEGISYIDRKVSIEAIYKPYEFNNMKVGFFNENGKVRILVYVNGRLAMNSLDEEPTSENLQAGHFFFQNGKNQVYLKGVDVKADIPFDKPVPVKKVGDIQTYDVTKMGDYSFRSFLTVFAGRRYTDANGTLIPYRIFLPANYSPNKKYPLAMYLHGSGVKGTDNQLQLGGDSNVHKAMLDYQKKEEFIYVVPQCTTYSWNENDYDVGYVVGYPDFEMKVGGREESAMGKALINLLDGLSQEFSVDKGRVYIGGASMGGMGAYGLLGRYPNKFAAAFIGCAAGDTTIANIYAKTPLCIAHGALDPAIDVKRARAMRDAVKAAGGQVMYEEYPDRYHDFTTRADLLQYIEWMLKKTKS